jgi:hypothetical protein
MEFEDQSLVRSWYSNGNACKGNGKARLSDVEAVGLASKNREVCRDYLRAAPSPAGGLDHPVGYSTNHSQVSEPRCVATVKATTAFFGARLPHPLKC